MKNIRSTPTCVSQHNIEAGQSNTPIPDFVSPTRSTISTRASLRSNTSSSQSASWMAPPRQSLSRQAADVSVELVQSTAGTTNAENNSSTLVTNPRILKRLNIDMTNNLNSNISIRDTNAAGTSNRPITGVISPRRTRSATLRKDPIIAPRRSLRLQTAPVCDDSVPSSAATTNAQTHSTIAIPSVINNTEIVNTNIPTAAENINPASILTIQSVPSPPKRRKIDIEASTSSDVAAFERNIRRINEFTNLNNFIQNQIQITRDDT